MRLPATEQRAPYPLPADGAPLRLAFVGQESFFWQSALTRPAAGVEPTFVDFRAGADAEAMLGAVRDFEPHLVFVFRPEIVPPGLFHGLPAAILGMTSEPLPRATDPEPHPDQLIRLEEFKEIDPSNFDRVISYDPHIVPAAEEYCPIWRSVPLPVDDRVFADVGPSATPPRIVFTGRSTDWRELFLLPVKHHFDVLHVVHGIHGEKLLDLLRETDVGINVHNEPYWTFENRVPVYMAAGALVISEPLHPRCGLEPGIDFLEIEDPSELFDIVTELHRYPQMHQKVRHRGRMKAEYFRASKVYPRLAFDLFADLAAFGTERPAS